MFLERQIPQKQSSETKQKTKSVSSASCHLILKSNVSEILLKNFENFDKRQSITTTSHLHFIPKPARKH